MLSIRFYSQSQCVVGDLQVQLLSLWMNVSSVTIEIKAIALYFPVILLITFIVLEWKNLCLIKFSTLVENFRKYCVIRLAVWRAVAVQRLRLLTS